MLHEYDQISKDYLKNSITEEVNENDLKNSIIEEVNENEVVTLAYYLPQHAVIKSERETTKIRIVFDASGKSYKNES